MIVILWRILLNFLLVWAELRRLVRTFFLCVKDAETLDLIFFPLSSREIWFGLICLLELISFSLTDSGMDEEKSGQF